MSEGSDVLTFTVLDQIMFILRKDGGRGGGEGVINEWTSRKKTLLSFAMKLAMQGTKEGGWNYFFLSNIYFPSQKSGDISMNAVRTI